MNQEGRQRNSTCNVWEEDCAGGAKEGDSKRERQPGNGTLGVNHP